MPRKVNEENERIKRSHLTYLREAKRADGSTVQRSAEAILRFEASTGYKLFKRFHIEQPRNFNAKLNEEISSANGKPLSKATISGILRANKAFFLWLAGQPGYKLRISYSDAEFSNQTAKDARIAHAQRETPYPTLAQCRHAFAPHSFRKTIAKWGVGHYTTRVALKDFSQNTGQDSLLTTYSAYLPVSQEQQAVLIRMTR
ncbi:MAG: hypothetical protein AAGK71_14205 [Pseudomonadota bacterium]